MVSGGPAGAAARELAEGHLTLAALTYPPPTRPLPLGLHVEASALHMILGVAEQNKESTGSDQKRAGKKAAAPSQQSVQHTSNTHSRRFHTATAFRQRRARAWEMTLHEARSAQAALVGTEEAASPRPGPSGPSSADEVIDYFA